MFEKDNIELFIDFFPEAIVLTDLEGNIIKCNVESVNLSGFSSKEELIGSNIFNFIEHVDHTRAMGSIKKLLSRGILKDVEYEIKNQNSRNIPIEISANVILDNSGKPYAFFCVIKNITERKKAEEAIKEARDNSEIKVKERTKELEEAYNALSESEEKFRELFNKANDVITLGVLTDDGMPGKFIEVNEVATHKLGYSKDELLNMTPLDIIQKDIDNAPLNALKIFDTGSTKFETVHVAKD
ncbi:MAG: PAS domain-containing protein, partial [Methanobacterium sp.]